MGLSCDNVHLVPQSSLMARACRRVSGDMLRGSAVRICAGSEDELLGFEVLQFGDFMLTVLLTLFGVNLFLVHIFFTCFWHGM